MVEAVPFRKTMVRQSKYTSLAYGRQDCWPKVMVAAMLVFRILN
jgi:hypothetical protein